MKRLIKPFKSISIKLFVLLTILLVFVFSVIIYININYYTNQIESNIRDHAIQASNLIKRSVRNSMLKNQREDLAITISNIGQEHYIENIRIFKKIGQIEFSTDSSEIYQTFDKKADLCIFCHTGEQPKGIIPKENQFRELWSEKYGKILGLVNPIENEPDCYNAACHAHSKDEKLLGYLDMTISLRDLEISASKARNMTLFFSIIFILLATVVIGRIIYNNVQQPISKLIFGTHQVADLNLDHTIDIDTTDEIGDLARSFNKMTEKIKSSNEKLKEWSVTLENKVNTKTEELEAAHQQLILSEKMASMGRLAEVVAHELNNPMSGILTYAQLLIKNLQNNPNQKSIKESIENLAIIRDESKRCGDIVKNLLLFSKQSYGERSKNNIKSLINKCLAIVQHSININNITLIKNFTQEEIIMTCDPSAMKQLVLAVLINAIEASPKKGGKLNIGLHQIEEEAMFRLDISDNGSGIPEEVIPHIFEPYYSTKDSGNNSGLGLMIAYGIVKSHGGTINVLSKKNNGTTFTINLPIDSQ